MSITRRRCGVAALLALAVASVAEPIPPGLRRVGEHLVAGRLAEAEALLPELLAREPENHQVLFTAASLAFKQRRREDAIRYFKRAAQLDPASPAHDILARLAPQVAGPCRLVEGRVALAEVFAFLVDFRRQREVERALARFRTKKGLELRMGLDDWREYLTFFQHYGYLERPGGPPTGKGAYVSDAAGDVRSTVYGSWRTRDRAPQVLREESGFCALPRDIAESIRAGDPGAVEFGFGLLQPADLVRFSRFLGGALYATEDPWAIDAVLTGLTRASEATSTLPAPLRPWLSRIGQRQRGTTRWRALALQRRFDLAPALPIPATHLPRVLAELEAGRVPVEAGILALEAFGAGAGSQLAATIRQGPAAHLGAVLDLVLALEPPEALEALVDTLTVVDPGWVANRWRVLAALRTVAGQDHGQDPAAWRAWLRSR